MSSQSWNGSLNIFLIQIMDMVVYPGLRRMGFVARPIFRITLGFMFGAAAMVYSAVLQV